jgi:hypothetical protein
MPTVEEEVESKLLTKKTLKIYINKHAWKINLTQSNDVLILQNQAAITQDGNQVHM